MSSVLIALINASERAANIARSCCKGAPEDGALFVAEKCGGDANARFAHDFKTIADVLAQEAAKTEIGTRCPELFEHVRGEECAEIGGVRIGLRGSAEETAELLSYVVPEAAAKQMAEAAHTEPNLSLCDKLPEDLPNINPGDLGVWIDPIDATSEFISGVRGEADADHGLPCVTVLVGAYIRATGVPVIGVINQPFFNEGKGRIIWGISYENTHLWGGSDMEVNTGPKSVLMSAAEKVTVTDKFRASGWEVKSVPGAGHKLLKVALGEAAMYIVSQGTTFRWDTCAPHAILRAKGGDILSYTLQQPITYNDPVDAETQFYCNADGIIAYNDPAVLGTIKDILNHQD